MNENIHIRWKKKHKSLTRRFPVLPSRWVLDSGIASEQWTLNPQHRDCRSLCLSCFCSLQILRLLLSVHQKMSSAKKKKKMHMEINLHVKLNIADKQRGKSKIKIKRRSWWKSLHLGKQIRKWKKTTLLHFTLEHCSFLNQRLCRHIGRRLDVILGDGRTAGELSVHHHMKHNSRREAATLRKPISVIIPRSLDPSPELLLGSTTTF